jgi:hypothetical protein
MLVLLMKVIYEERRSYGFRWHDMVYRVSRRSLQAFK